jgi:hypothetical protein
MAKTWILDTETKGTGANMVPLEDDRAKKKERSTKRVFVAPNPRPRPEPEPEPRRPPRFKVVDVMTRETLAEDADGRATVNVLKGVRSIVDVRISAWDHANGAWRLLTWAEQRAIWDLRDR